MTGVQTCALPILFAMMKKLLLPILFYGCNLFAQTDTVAIRFSKIISADNLRKNLTVLASDEYEGRETGKKGQKMAADYISKQFRDYGTSPVNGNYFQPFSLVLHNPQQLKISTKDKSFQSTVDYFSPSAIFKDTMIELKKILFAGYGIADKKYNDYANTDSSISAVMIMAGEPLKKNMDFLLGKGKNPSNWSTVQRMKVDEAKRFEKKIIFIVEGDFEKSLQDNAHRIYSGRMRLAEDEDKNYTGLITIHISKKMANEILRESGQSIQTIAEGITSSSRPNSFELKTDLNLKVFQTIEKIESENVVGFVEGNDLKDELVVITAHYDHLDRKSTRLNSSHIPLSRMPSSA